MLPEHTFRKTYEPYISPFDPCPPIPVKTYETPPQLYLGFQPKGLEQFPTPQEALKHGTLWPALYAPYSSPYRES
ncbi:spore coat associated protein CotJA [Pullulanibacillus sp. KACC 23026]|uniref:spore coat associated protein CotJA n=1 Tax=Pullulanibacillus sp. KACC 23026 TaxID=3028315 RepID=UPI0023B09EF1|nr:spore coat associated protein CotJA [Pullulanibacillus sp. KACC 23026]WEG11403.1 spore coat associated protein CotJA [Pullulanibacillus sp. KACC 23026]